MAARRDSLRLELACFAALAAFAVLEWTSLVADPPTLRALLVVAIATGAGLGARRPRPGGLSRTARLSLIVALALATVALAMVAIGLPAELLLPGHWDELSARLGRTLPGVGDVSTPYRGADGWTRLTILLAAPLTVVPRGAGRVLAGPPAIPRPFRRPGFADHALRDRGRLDHPRW